MTKITTEECAGGPNADFVWPTNKPKKNSENEALDRLRKRIDRQHKKFCRAWKKWAREFEEKLNGDA